MAGHSKWANIKHRKEKADQKKGKVFSRIIKELLTAVKHGGPDPKTNSKLRIVLQKAKEANIPNENIERNIKKGLETGAADYTEMTYEFYGYGGVGILVDVLTDNKNRIASEMRIATNKKGGTIASPGGVAYNFERKGVIQVLKEKVEEAVLFSIAAENGAEDFESDETFYYITTPVDGLYLLKEVLDLRKIPIAEASWMMLPKTMVECSVEDQAANEALIEWLENIDDVDDVYHNMAS